MYKIIFYIISCVVIISLVVSCFLLYCSDTYPIKHVIVQSDKKIVDQDTVKKILMPLVNKGFFSIDVDEIQGALQGLDEISKVNVRRIWNNKIVIKLELDKAIARWSDSDFLNQYGETFISKDKNFDIPIFYGDRKDAICMLDYYQQINELIEGLDIKVTKIFLDSKKSLDIELDNRTKLKLGEGNVLHKMKRFVSMYPKIFTSTGRAKNIDLRYEYGMAVS